MARGLTKKQKGFVREYVATGNGTQAALKNYDVKNERVAASVASENLTKPEIVQAIAERLPDDLLEEKHVALLNKEEVIVRNNVTSGEIEVIPTGQIDVQAVSKGLDMAYKLKGAYAPDKNLNLNVALTNISNETLDELSNRLEAIEIQQGANPSGDGTKAVPMGKKVSGKN